jgi:error-prone DNA polymerase
MRLLRRELRRRGVRAIADLAEVPAGHVVRVAGWPISAQRPPTAKGMAFLVLEDETGRVQVAVTPKLADQMYRFARHTRVVLAAGRLEREQWHHSLLAVSLFDGSAIRPTPAEHLRRAPAVTPGLATGAYGSTVEPILT